MAITKSIGLAKKPTRHPAAWHTYAAAVLSGIYASTGRAILGLENHHYAKALRNAKKVAHDQADEMLRRDA